VANDGVCCSQPDELGRGADQLFARRLKQAGMTLLSTLAHFDWTFKPKVPEAKLVELASARFVDSHSGPIDWAARCRRIAHCHGRRPRAEDLAISNVVIRASEPGNVLAGFDLRVR
jgi:hypothetical protein